MELALPIISNPKILKKVDFGFMSSIFNELVSRSDGVYFKANYPDRIMPEKANEKVSEEYLFRKSRYGSSTLFLFYFFECHATLIVPFVKHIESQNDRLRRLEKHLNKMNPADFKYKILKNQWDNMKTAFMTYKIFIDDYTRMKRINKFYESLFLYLIEQFK